MMFLARKRARRTHPESDVAT